MKKSCLMITLLTLTAASVTHAERTKAAVVTPEVTEINAVTEELGKCLVKLAHFGSLVVGSQELEPQTRAAVAQYLSEQNRIIRNIIGDPAQKISNEELLARLKIALAYAQKVLLSCQGACQMNRQDESASAA